jgi:hypothetical protein
MIIVPRGPIPDSEVPFEGVDAEPGETVDAMGEDGEWTAAAGCAAGGAMGCRPGLVVVVSGEPPLGRTGATGMTGVVRSVDPGASALASACACWVAAKAAGACRPAGASNACGGDAGGDGGT